MTRDLSEMSLNELKQLKRDVTKAIETFEERKRQEARARLEEQAREMGFKLSDLLSAETGKKTKKNPPKYRHPENPEITWTGRGRKPKWIVDALARGKSLDDMKIE